MHRFNPIWVEIWKPIEDNCKTLCIFMLCYRTIDTKVWDIVYVLLAKRVSIVKIIYTLVQFLEPHWSYLDCDLFYSFIWFGRYLNFSLLFRSIFCPIWGIQTLSLSLEPAQKLGFLSMNIFPTEALKIDWAAETTLPHYPGKLESKWQQSYVLFFFTSIIAVPVE